MEHNRKSLVSFMVLGLLLSSWITAANAQTPEKIAEKALGSTVLLTMQRPDGKGALGSGFFVADGQIATNYHVIEGAVKGTAKLVGGETAFNIEGHTAIDKARDLAVLKVTTLRAPALSLGNSDTVKVGETVYAVGNPRGLEGTFSQGNISSIRPEGNTAVRGKVLQITAPISPGSSGGAVLNSNGKVIGIAVATVVNGQNLNFAIPSNYLKALLVQAGEAKSLSTDAPSDVRRFLLDLFILGVSVFVVVQILPLAKVKAVSTTVGVSIVFGILQTLLSGVLMLFVVPMIILALGLADIVINAVLLWFTNKLIRGFEINGFFKTVFTAVLIAVVERALNWLIAGA